MNALREEAGNPAMAEGRDIPWLQDSDVDGDGRGDNWLESWPFEYRDVVIVDPSGTATDAFNLTLHSLEEPDSYATLRQMLIDVATNAIAANDDVRNVASGKATEIDVLQNDEGSRRLEIGDVLSPANGTAQAVSVDYPADLDPLDWAHAELVISEIVPGEYIELYNSSYLDEVSIESLQHVLVSGDFSVDVATLSPSVNERIPARGYQQLDWPQGLAMTSESGELILYQNRERSFDTAWGMVDFVAWGEVSANSRITLARRVGKWEGPPDGSLDLNAIQRIPGTGGIESHSYDNHRPSTPGNAINDAVESKQVIRYVAPDDFTGIVDFEYTVADETGETDTASVRLNVASAPRSWQNPVDPLDVNNDGEVSAADALAVIRAINGGLRGTLPAELNVPLMPAPFLDCNGNNSVEPHDALMIINRLNSVSETPAGEPATRTQAMATDMVLASLQRESERLRDDRAEARRDSTPSGE